MILCLPQWVTEAAMEEAEVKVSHRTHKNSAEDVERALKDTSEGYPNSQRSGLSAQVTQWTKSSSQMAMMMLGLHRP